MIVGRRSAAFAAIIIGLGLLGISTAGMLARVEPFATWYYSLAWYPTILVLDGLVAWRTGSFFLLGRWRFLASLLFWSAICWLYYELFNFRLLNWYYVFLPHGWLLRNAGTVIAFATVLPALFTMERLLDALGALHRTTWRPWRIGPGFLTGMRVLGAILLALVLLLPKYFFPFVWIGTALLVEPVVYERDRERSLLADLENGRPGRILRLLLAGFLVGFLWELFNIEARTKWIYTVPFFDELKLFEMPVLGFLGFPPFTLECFVLWQFLVTAGLAVDRDGATFPLSRARRIGGFVAGSAFAVGVLAGIQTRTIESLKPRLQDLAGVPAEALESAGYDAFSLASAEASIVAAAANASEDSARIWVERARIAAHRGIGAENASTLAALGIHTIEELAAADADSLAAAVGELQSRTLPPARARVWVRGARRLTQ